METHDPVPRPIRARLLLAGWHVMRAGVLLYGLNMCGYVLARATIGERWNVVAFANNFVPWWAFGGAVTAGIALVSRRRWLLVPPNVPIIVLFVVNYGYLLVPRASEAGPANRGPTLTAATYNVIASQSDPVRVVDVIGDLDADIAGLQELGPRHATRIDEVLAARYPYRVLYPMLPVHGVGLLSRYPVIEHSVFRPFPDSMLHLRAVLDVDGSRVTVYVVHPSPPRDVLLPFTYNDARRNTEITILREDYLEAEHGPLIVLGDFNMSDQSTPYRQVDVLLTDAFREAGHGLGFSFPDSQRSLFGGLPLLLRIDYIWHSAHFSALDARVGHDSGTSDHRPVTAVLALSSESGNSRGSS